MLTNVATVLAGLIGAGIILIGARQLWRPQSASGFGIPGTPTEDRNFRAWLSVKSVRDIGMGLLTFLLLAGATPHLLGWFMLAASAIPVGDAVIVLRSNGPKTAVYGIHIATAAVMLTIGALLLIA